MVENRNRSKMHLSMMRKCRTQKYRIVTLVPEDGGGTIDKIDNSTFETVMAVSHKSPSKMLPSTMR
jgi:hypothetical protein